MSEIPSQHPDGPDKSKVEPPAWRKPECRKVDALMVYDLKELERVMGEAAAKEMRRHSLKKEEEDWMNRRWKDPHPGCGKKEEDRKITIGLALSGGGIRSATFNLGVIQALSKLRWKRSSTDEHEKEENGEEKKREGGSLLEAVDYLSTVSGGGYIGAWLVSCWRRVRDQILYDKKTGTKTRVGTMKFLDDQSEELRHLRKHSRYLAPEEGLMKADTWTMLSIWARNTLLVQAMVVAWIFAAFLFIRLCAALFDIFAGAGMKNAPGWVHPVADDRLTAQIAQKWNSFMGGSWPLVIVSLALAWSWIVIAREVLRCNRSAGLKNFGFVEILNRFMDDLELRKQRTQQWLHCIWNGEAQKTLQDAEPPERNSGAVSQGTSSEIAEPTIQQQKIQGRTVWDLTQGQVIWRIVVPSMMSALFLAILFLRGTVSKWTAGSASFCPAPLMPPEKQWVVAAVGGVMGLIVSFVVIGPRKLLLYVLVTGVAALIPWGVVVGMENALLALGPEGTEIARLYVAPSFLLAGVLLVVMLIGLMGTSMIEQTREWLSRLGAWLGIAWVTWVGLKVLIFHGPDWVNDLFGSAHRLKEVPLKAWGAVGMWILSTVCGYLAAKNRSTSGRETAEENQKKGILEFVAVAGPYVALAGWLLLVSWLVNWLLGGEVNWRVGNGHAWRPGAGFPDQGFYWLIGSTAVGVILMKQVNLNDFSMNRFYRNRLVRCYLGASRWKTRGAQRFTGFDFNDDIPLSEKEDDNLSPQPDEGYSGPYPIICAALNTSAGGDLDTQERRAESFVFTPVACGAERVRIDTPASSALQGYRPANEYATRAGDDAKPDRIGYGTCVSISGAAVSPNSGYHTLPVVAFFLTLFNGRIGWWLPNPVSADNWKSASPAKFGWFGWFGCLMMELFGSASPTKDFVYVSDGGHFENLGLYELVRRRCKFIIVGDAEEDGDLQFYALGTAIRRCRIDFNADIQVDVSQIQQRDANGVSRASCAVGTICYDGEKEPSGTLVYLKLSMNGSEPEDVQQYRAVNPKFPHEPTLQQFFTESQFESYRILGETIAATALGFCWKSATRMTGKEFGAGMEEFAENLRDAWACPSKAAPGTFVKHTQMLSSIWRRMQETPQFAFMDKKALLNFKTFQELLTTIEETDRPKDEHIRDVDYLCQEMIQLMESVYVDLKLDLTEDDPDNQGWKALFQSWAELPVLQAAWEASKHSFGRRFQVYFGNLVKQKQADVQSKSGSATPPVA